MWHLPENAHFLECTVGSDLLIHHLFIFCTYSFPRVDSVIWGGYQPHVLIPTNSSGPLPPCSWYPQDGVTAEAPSCLLQATLSQAPRTLQFSLKGAENSEVPCICCCYCEILHCCLYCPMRNSLGLTLRMRTWARNAYAGKNKFPKSRSEDQGGLAFCFGSPASAGVCCQQTCCCVSEIIATHWSKLPCLLKCLCSLLFVVQAAFKSSDSYFFFLPFHITNNLWNVEQY